MIWFADSSALVKRYVNEQGSSWLRRELTRHQIIIAQITSIEVVAALKRRFRQGDISEFAFYQARKRFMAHGFKQQYKTIEMSTQIVEEALRIVSDQDLRAYDSVQLAAALITLRAIDKKRFFFITADSQLETVALAEGLQTDNPLNH